MIEISAHLNEPVHMCSASERKDDSTTAVPVVSPECCTLLRYARASLQEQKRARREATREKKSEAMKLAHAARRAGVATAAAAAGTAATGVATVGGFQTLIVEDATLPHATAPPPAGDLVLSSQLAPEKLSLLLQVPPQEPSYTYSFSTSSC